MKFFILCLICGKIIQTGDKDAPKTYAICDDCKKGGKN